MSQQYEYFGLLPQSQRGSPGVHVSLYSYLPGSVNTLTVTPNFDEGQFLPFDGNVVPRNHILIEQAYNSPDLLGVVGHSKEMLQYYQSGKPQYIEEHYQGLNIPLSTSQSQYMSSGGFAYENLYNPLQPTTLPST
jgi:hypothetical protein